MSARLRIKVIPGARQEALEQHGELWRVKVTVAPEKGRANAAVLALLARLLDLPVSSLQVVAGHTSAFKVIEFATLDPPALNSSLASLPS